MEMERTKRRPSQKRWWMPDVNLVPTVYRLKRLETGNVVLKNVKG